MIPSLFEKEMHIQTSINKGMSACQPYISLEKMGFFFSQNTMFLFGRVLGSRSITIMWSESSWTLETCIKNMR